MATGSTLPQLYLVPCTCGKKVQVRARQAGDQVTCQCGAVVNVPTIRGLKNLETIVDEAERPAALRSSWQGPLFSLGVISFCIGVAILVVAWAFPPVGLNLDWRKLAQNEADARRADKPVAELNVNELHEEFLMLRDRTRDAPFDRLREQSEAAQTFQRSRHWAGGLFTGVGGLLTIAGLMLPSITSRKP